MKGYLSRKGIPFVERNFSEDEQARKDLLALGYRSTPVAVIGEKRITGFKPSVLDEALKGYQP